MAQQAVAEVVGLKALMKDVNRLTKDERSPLFAAMKEAGYNAIKPVVPATRGELPHSDRPRSRTHIPGALSGSIRASAYRSGAAVRMGSKTVPQAGWIEFGGTRKQPHVSSRQFVKDGRYLFPTAKANAPRAVSEYTRSINQLFGKTAIWTNASNTAGSVHD